MYADASGTVVAVEHDIPAADPTARCRGPTRDVLELPAGAARTVAPGDRLRIER